MKPTEEVAVSKLLTVIKSLGLFKGGTYGGP